MRDLPRRAAVLLTLGPLLAGCTLPIPPHEIRTPLRQLLVSRALAGSADQIALGLPEGAAVTLDAAGLTGDHAFARDVVVGWLGRQELRVVEDAGEADYHVRLVVESLGNEQGLRFFGLPPAQSNWIPISIPEITLFKRNRSKGYARVYLDVFESADRRHVRTTPPYEAAVHFTKYTILFGINWRTTDLDPRPQGIDVTEPGRL